MKNVISRTSVHKNGFDQWGVMFGTAIRENNNNEEDVYFRGLRERILPKAERMNNIIKSLTVTGVSQHGFHFTINQNYYEDGM